MDVSHVQYLRVDGDLLVYCAEINDNFSNKHLLPAQANDDTSGKLYKLPATQPQDQDQNLDMLPEDYKSVLHELDEQSSLIDEEIRKINTAPAETVRKPPRRFDPRTPEIPSADTSENEDPEMDRKEEKKRKRNSRFEKFMQKLKKKGKKKKRSTAASETSDSEFSTDFENYLLGTDSEVSSRDSPTDLLQQIGDSELIRLASERLEEIEKQKATDPRIKRIERDPKAALSKDGQTVKYYYNLTGNSEEPIEIPLAEVFEEGRQGDKSGKVSVKTQDGKTVEIERTKLRICTQVLGEGETVVSESTAESEAENQNGKSPVQYHVIHHHVHHHVAVSEDDMDGELKVPLEKASLYPDEPPPRYGAVPDDPEAGKPRRMSRYSLLCCYGL